MMPCQRLLGFAAAALLAAGAGCAEKLNRPDLHPLSGGVFVNGKPAVGALITFHPTDKPDWKALRPFALVGADGTFKAGTYDPEDGVPAGTYRVTVVWAPVSTGGPEPDRLKGIYGDTNRPAATVTVAPGPNTLEPLQLKAAK